MNDKTVSAIFDTHADAERAIADLRAAGVSDASLSMYGRDETAATATTHGTVEGDGHSDSIVTGGPEDDTIESKPVARGLVGGAALGALVGVVALAIPGVGPLLAAGAVSAAAVPGAMGAGALIGAGAGGLREAINHHGMHDEDAAYYEEHVARGGILLAVDVAASGLDATDLTDILDRAGGHNARTARATQAAEPVTAL